MPTQKILILAHEGAPPEVFFALSFDGRFPHDNATFHEGFKASGQQAHTGTRLRRVPDA